MAPPIWKEGLIFRETNGILGVHLFILAVIASIQCDLRGHQEFSYLKTLPCKLIIYIQMSTRDLFQGITTVFLINIIMQFYTLNAEYFKLFLMITAWCNYN